MNDNNKIILLFIIFILFLAIFALIIFFITLKDNNQKISKNNISITPKVKLGQNKEFIVRAAIPYWNQDQAFQSLQANYKKINIISLFWYYLDSSGNISKYEYADEDLSIIEFAKENNIKVSAVLTNLPESGTWDSERVENIINNSSNTAKHIKDIKALVLEKGFDGITIDYESVNRNQEKNFTKFIKELSEALHKKDKYVEVALHPKSGASGDQRYSYQNWSELSEYADLIYIMAYEEHYNEGPSGPVASLPWVRKILDYAKMQNIPNEKLLLGIPLDGYDWNKDNDEAANGVNYDDVMQLKNQNNAKENYDNKFKSPYLRYKLNGQEHEVWFENAESVNEKINLAKDYNLEGITFWKLGGEDNNIWNLIQDIKGD